MTADSIKQPAEESIEELEAKILREFYVHAEDFLKKCEACILRLGHNCDLPENHRLIFRYFHGLHGGAAMVRLTEVTAISRHLENLMEGQPPEGPFDARFIDYLLQGVQALRRVLDGQSTWFELIDPLA